MKKLLLIPSLLFVTAGFSQTISTEAPSVSASAVTIPKGFLQGELSLAATINNDSSPFVERSYDAPFLLLRYGLSERFEVRLHQNTVLRTTSFTSELNVKQFGGGVKFALLPNEGTTNLAVIGTFSPRINNWESRQGDLLLSFGQSIGKKGTFGANFGYSLFDSNSLGKEPENTWRENILLGSAVYSHQLWKRLTAFGEFYYSYNESKLVEFASTTQTYGVDFGLQFILRENIQLDYVSGFNLSNKEHFHSLGFNIYLNTL